MLNTKMCALAIAAGCVTNATADRVVVDISVGAPSAIDLQLCQDLPIVGGCDTDMSPITGTVRFFVDTNANLARLIDFDLMTTESLDYSYSGTLSQIDATASTVDVFYAGAAPSDAVPVLAGGAFAYTGVPIDIAGTAAVTGTILAIGAVNEAIDFADFGPFVSDLTGTVTEAGGVWTLNSGASFDETTTGEVLGITVTSTATGTLSIVGTGSASPACAGDCNFDGSVNIDDIDCFVAGFLASDIATADCDGNGALNLDDIDCFVASFLAGCP